jgi:C-terminal processing protease CtpA/Prc
MGFDSDDITVGKVIELRITKLEPGLPADKAHLEVGDVVTKIAGKTFKNTDGYLDATAKAAESPTYEVEFIRAGQPMKATLERAFRPTWTEAVTPAVSAPTPQLAAQSSVADELLKLKKLKDDGVITNEQFEAQKTKLLRQ